MTKNMNIHNLSSRVVFGSVSSGSIGGSRPGQWPSKILVSCAYCLPLYFLRDGVAEPSDSKDNRPV